MDQPYRKFENFHIVLWLLKDFCWIANFKVTGMIMVFPTIFMAFYIAYRSRETKSELWHNLAVVSWIMANSIWMYGEFYRNDTTRPYAMVFFVLGFLFVAYHYFISEPFWKKSEEEAKS